MYGLRQANGPICLPGAFGFEARGPPTATEAVSDLQTILWKTEVPLPSGPRNVRGRRRNHLRY